MSYLIPITSLTHSFPKISLSQKGCLLGLFLSSIILIKNILQRNNMHNCAAAILTASSSEGVTSAFLPITKIIFPHSQNLQNAQTIQNNLACSVPTLQQAKNLPEYLSRYEEYSQQDPNQTRYNFLWENHNFNNINEILFYIGKISQQEKRIKIFTDILKKYSTGALGSSNRFTIFYHLDTFLLLIEQHTGFETQSICSSSLLSHLRDCVLLKGLEKHNSISKENSSYIHRFLKIMHPVLAKMANAYIKDNFDDSQKWKNINLHFLLSLFDPDDKKKENLNSLYKTIQEALTQSTDRIALLEQIFTYDFTQLLSDNQIITILQSVYENPDPDTLNRLALKLPYIHAIPCPFLNEGRVRVLLAITNYAVTHADKRDKPSLKDLAILKQPIKDAEGLLKRIKILEKKYFQKKGHELFFYIIKQYVEMDPKTEGTKKGLTSFLLSHGPSLAMPSLSMLFFVTIYGILGYLKK